jgi:Protein of unknown function (DUF3043)
LFRRTKSDTQPAESGGATRVDSADALAPAGGKGRPTPTRKEAEAAARARAKAALDPKASKSKQRSHQVERSREIRAGIKAGDERYLPTRDQGPVRRFVRDFVDHRLSMAEFAIPLLFSSLLASALGFAQAGTGIMNATMIVVVVDSVLLRWRMRREIARRFPGESTKGTTIYAFMRALQLRFLRLPKPQVKVGQVLPEHYR